MATGEDASKDELDQFFLSKKNLLQGIGEGPDVLAGIGDFGFRGVLHGVQGKVCCADILFKEVLQGPFFGGKERLLPHPGATLGLIINISASAKADFGLVDIVLAVP